MNMQTIMLPFTRAVSRNIPVTARGRALYTTDWFMNGQPRAVNYDAMITNNKKEHRHVYA